MCIRDRDTVYAEADKKNVYTYGPIIHNTEVVNELESKGVNLSLIHIWLKYFISS